MSRPRPVVTVIRLGLLSYSEALRVQQSYVNKHKTACNTNPLPHTLLLCEHPPVYTVGLRSSVYPNEELQKLQTLGAETHRTNRGGLITFHGPGQLVCYPIIHLGDFKKSVRWYVCQLERTVVSLCQSFGLEAETSPHTGVWIRDNKICAIGIHCGRYITSHGLALNCNTDLEWFGHVVPCGIEGRGVTSLSKELNTNITVEETTQHLIEAFRDTFDCRITDAQKDHKQNEL